MIICMKKLDYRFFLNEVLNETKPISDDKKKSSIHLTDIK